MRAIFFMLFISLIAALDSDSPRWRVYSSPDKSFSVELPAPLQRVTFFEGKHGASNEQGLDADKNVSYYAALQSTPKVREYGVIVIDEESKGLSPPEREKRVAGLEFLIGGDDAIPTSERTVHANGLTGKEYVYAEEIADGIYTRGRIFDAGKKIYVIVFRGRTAEDLSSPDAERFLNSFRPTHHLSSLLL
jgi:hypothetical protein